MFPFIHPVHFIYYICRENIIVAYHKICIQEIFPYQTAYYLGFCCARLTNKLKIKHYYDCISFELRLVINQISGY